MGKKSPRKKPIMKSEPIKNESKLKWFNDISSITIIISLALCAIIYLWKIIFSGGMLPGHPSDLIELPVLSQIDSIINYHQFPLWDNLWISGFPEYASPISALYDPLITIPYLLFGLVNGVKFITVFHVFLAGISFWLFSTTITSNKVVQFYGSLLFMFSGSLSFRIDPGHTELMTTQMFIPLTLFFVIKAIESKDLKYIILSSISMSMFVFGGAIYYFVFFMVMFFIYSITKVVDAGEYEHKNKYNKQNLKILSSIFILFLMFCSIKLIPVLTVSDSILRIDPIDPFKGSGIFKNMVTSFATGHTYHSSYAYLGFLPFIFAISSLFIKIKDKLFLCASFVIFLLWAGGNNTFFGVFHLLPFLDNFRVPGRSLLFASFIVITLSMYGLHWLLESFEKDKKTVKPILFVIGTIMFFEIQEIIVSFIKNITSAPRFEIIGILFVVSIAMFILLKRSPWQKSTKNLAFILIAFSMIAASNTNIEYINPYENVLDDSTAQNIMTEIKNYDGGEHEQIWLTTNGWPYQHTEFAYNSMVEGMHMQRAYYAYYLKDTPSSILISDTTYYAANYLIDTQYLESGNKFNMPPILSVDGISVHKLENSLPNVFVVRNGNIIPLEIKFFSPNKVVADGSDIQFGDVVVYKAAYYKGWKVNGMNAQNLGNMIGTEIKDPNGDITFTFEPSDFKVGAIITTITVLIYIAMFMRRRELNKYFEK